MAERVTVRHIRAMHQRGERIVCVTAYDSVFGELADLAGVDLILVGDSVGNVVLGRPNTVYVTLADMVHHTKAVRTGVSRALLVGDLPFGSYQTSIAQAVEAAVALMRSGAEAVKIEGDYISEIAACVRAGIPVMGHLGMTPQSVNQFGGYRVQGKGPEGDLIVDAAKKVADAGAFAIVLELVPAELAKRITETISVPTIGIGAGIGCSGQIQVIHDVMGLSAKKFRHAHPFVDGRNLLLNGLVDYSNAVRDSTFPSDENSF